MKKLRVYMNEFNVVMGKYRYLPYSTGLIRAYAETDPAIKSGYEFMPFLYEMDTVDNVLARYTEQPNIAAFSISMWNEQLNLKVAAEVKKRWSDCVIIFGGCHVPHHPKEYMEQHKFIDVCVRADGEEAFKLLLLNYLDRENCLIARDVPDTSYRYDKDDIIENLERFPFEKDLDKYPSPYLMGLFDDLIAAQTQNHQFQAIIETNRGCPFDCSFCYWAQGGLALKYKFHGMDYVKDEVEWMGKNRVAYLFGADSNFAMHRRDKEIAEHIVAVKKKYGYPDKFRVCFGKNTDEKIFEVAGILHSAGLEKGITLARQSNDETTLKNIRRDNIKLSTYRNLQTRFNDQEVPVYSELILGLPGETVESWKKGIDELITSGLKNQIFVYLAQVLPNTELANPEYQKKHGIRTKKVELAEIHGSKRDDSWIKEYEEIVISTNSMPYDQWREMCKFSWATMLLHSMKAGFFVMAWLWDRFKIPPSELIQHYKNPCWDKLLDDMTVFGQGRGTILPEYGDIYWDVEEAALLKLLEDREGFWGSFGPMRIVVERILEDKGIEINWPEFYDVLTYQKYRMPIAKWQSKFTLLTYYNIPEYFDKLFGSDPVPLEHKPQAMTLHPKHFDTKEQFARETILWGRKSGTMLVPCTYEDVK